MAKPNKENIITAILEQLNAGTTYTDCFKVILSNFKLSEPTFATYWKDANSRYLQTQQEAQQAMNDTTVSEAVKAAKSGLKSKIERMAELQAFLHPDYMVTDTIFDLKAGHAVDYQRKLTPTEIRNYHAELSKMGGDYAPAKVAQTDSEGNDKQSNVIELPNGVVIPI